MNFPENIQVNKIEMKPKILFPGLNVFSSLLINWFPQRNLKSVQLSSLKGYYWDRFTNGENYLQIIAGKSKLGLCCINESGRFAVVFNGADGIRLSQNSRPWKDILFDSAQNIATYRSIDLANTHIWSIESNGGLRRGPSNIGRLLGRLGALRSCVGRFLSVNQAPSNDLQLPIEKPYLERSYENQAECERVRYRPLPPWFILLVLGFAAIGFFWALALTRKL